MITRRHIHNVRTALPRFREKLRFISQQKDVIVAGLYRDKSKVFTTRVSDSAVRISMLLEVNKDQRGKSIEEMRELFDPLSPSQLDHLQEQGVATKTMFNWEMNRITQVIDVLEQMESCLNVATVKQYLRLEKDLIKAKGAGRREQLANHVVELLDIKPSTLMRWYREFVGGGGFKRSAVGRHVRCH